VYEVSVGNKDYVRTVVVGRLVPSKGLLLVCRALDESIESAVPYLELSAVPHSVEMLPSYVEIAVRMLSGLRRLA
jgi:hypothetical protein